jgi:hypothetical protein
MTDMVGTLMSLIGQQDKSGNWPTKAPSMQGGNAGDNELVQYVYNINELAPDAEFDVSRVDGVMALRELSFYYQRSSGDHSPFRNDFL